jgi:hypothetical protein
MCVPLRAHRYDLIYDPISFQFDFHAAASLSISAHGRTPNMSVSLRGMTRAWRMEFCGNSCLDYFLMSLFAFSTREMAGGMVAWSREHTNFIDTASPRLKFIQCRLLGESRCSRLKNSPETSEMASRCISSVLISLNRKLGSFYNSGSVARTTAFSPERRKMEDTKIGCIGCFVK